MYLGSTHISGENHYSKSLSITLISADIIKNWIRNRGTIEFIRTCEQLHNPKFKVVSKNGGDDE